MDACWLNCEISAGQFPAEVAVRVSDFQGESVSLFVSNQFTQPSPSEGGGWIAGKLLVEVLDESDKFFLVYLPGQTFANGQAITVQKDQLTPCKPTQNA